MKSTKTQSDPGTKPWFIDGRTGVTATYGDLLAELNGSPGSLRPLCQPTSTQDALREIAASIIFGTELTLFDSDFGERELVALGFGKEQLNQPKPTPAATRVDLAALQKTAAGDSAAKLGLFTSGSTGLPKLVWQSVSNLARAVKVSPRHSEAVWAFAYNPTHVAGIQVYLQALANGCPVVDVFGLDRAGVLAAMERHKVTHISATPSFYRLLLPVDRPLPAVKSVTLGGESSDAALIERLRPLFPAARFHNVYASTEAGTLLAADGDVFSIAVGLERQVLIKDGTLRVHRSLLGEFDAPLLAAANPVFVLGSRGRETEAKTTAGEEWYDTGDVVEVVSNEPLRFRIVARERDWVNVGGSKVNPREVEAVLEEFPGVRKVRVFGRKNSVMGHILCAEIVLRKADEGRRTVVALSQPGIGPRFSPSEIEAEKPEDRQPTEQDLRAWLAERLQPFKVPRLIRFVDTIAQTRTGKVRRTDD